jgi:hypothetical protein
MTSRFLNPDMERIVKAAARLIEGMVLGGEPRRRSAGG